MRPTPHTALEDAQGLASGAILCAFGVLLLTSAGLMTGQTAGLAVLISYASGWAFGPVFFVVNLPFYALALARMGLRFTLKTFAAVALLAIAAAQHFPDGPMDLRNIAIIAHVDHGKTTLVDELLKQSGAFRENQAVVERAMDSNDIERERGITILAKAPRWNGAVRASTSSTPPATPISAARWSASVSMVDGVCLLVDAAEGPMPQTKFVTAKALALGLRPIVVLNKVDKPAAEPDRALNDVFDLFANLGADDSQLDFPCSMPAASTAGPIPSWTGRAKTCRRCSIW
jgi:small GTP-binding protein